MCVCLYVREHISGTTGAIFIIFSVHVAYGRGSVLLRQSDEIPRRRGNFGDCSGHAKALAIFAGAVAAAFAAKGIIQSPITSNSRRDHSVCKASANRNPENSERGDAAYRPGRGWWECTARAKSAIYVCLVRTGSVQFSRGDVIDRRRMNMFQNCQLSSFRPSSVSVDAMLAGLYLTHRHVRSSCFHQRSFLATFSASGVLLIAGPAFA